ncbi:MAG TPA: hypothetical protein VLA44_09610 [Clostridia bacterium]|nr:hypothetical protein [Clostridia bacterium]
MTDEAPKASRGDEGSADLADPADHTQPAEGGRAEVADLPGADTSATRIREEDDQDVD